MNLLQVKLFIARSHWDFAHTMPESPHWYIMRGKGDSKKFDHFAAFINQNGRAMSWRGKIYIYLDVDLWRYWTMSSKKKVNIINREIIKFSICEEVKKDA